MTIMDVPHWRWKRVTNYFEKTLASNKTFQPNEEVRYEIELPQAKTWWILNAIGVHLTQDDVAGSRNVMYTRFIAPDGVEVVPIGDIDYFSHRAIDTVNLQAYDNGYTWLTKYYEAGYRKVFLRLAFDTDKPVFVEKLVFMMWGPVSIWSGYPKEYCTTMQPPPQEPEVPPPPPPPVPEVPELIGGREVTNTPTGSGKMTRINLTDVITVKGTAVKWRIRNNLLQLGGLPAKAKLKIFRDDGVNYALVGQSSLVTLPRDTNWHEFECNIPVEVGDLVGLYVEIDDLGDRIGGHTDIKAVWVSGDVGTLAKAKWNTATHPYAERSVAALYGHPEHAIDIVSVLVKEPVEPGDTFQTHAYVKCPKANCDLTGKVVEIYDHKGSKVGEGTLAWNVDVNEAVISLTAPPTEGTYTWTLKFPTQS